MGAVLRFKGITPLFHHSRAPIFTTLRLFTSGGLAIFFSKLSNIRQKPLPHQDRLDPKRTEVNHG